MRKSRCCASSLAAALLFTASISAQTPPRLNPAVKQVVDGVSEQRIAANLKKLESFGSRNVLSPSDDPNHGIGAAKRWLHDELQSYSPRLRVSYQDFVNAKALGLRDAAVSNVIAVLPGTDNPEACVLITAHYDSLNLIPKPPVSDEVRMAEMVKAGGDEAEARLSFQLVPASERGGPPPDMAATAAQELAPGVADNGSGTAALLELARVMSRYQFRKTVIFVAFAAEETGLDGSKAYAAMAAQSNKEKGLQIEAVLNNDIIGTDVAGNGLKANNVVRLFAAGPEDSPARTVQRYAKQIGERYVPSMRVQMVFRRDRFNRGGDQNSFTPQGFAAVRFTTPAENYANQHSATDTFLNTSVPYTASVARVNGAVLASLALAPSPPSTTYQVRTGPAKGSRIMLLTRGASGYDAVMRWMPAKGANIAGYSILIRATTAPDWEREIPVGNVTTYTLRNFSIDDVVIGVRAVDTEGNQSLVAPYLESVFVSAPAK